MWAKSNNNVILRDRYVIIPEQPAKIEALPNLVKP